MGSRTQRRRQWQGGPDARRDRGAEADAGAEDEMAGRLAPGGGASGDESGALALCLVAAGLVVRRRR